MTTKREYSCNVCRDVIEGPFGGAEGGYGIHFEANRGGAFTFRKIRDAETHICLPCLETIGAFVAAQRKEP